MAIFVYIHICVCYVCIHICIYVCLLIHIFLDMYVDVPAAIHCHTLKIKRLHAYIYMCISWICV